jgi:hypothetical protein
VVFFIKRFVIVTLDIPALCVSIGIPGGHVVDQKVSTDDGKLDECRGSVSA